MSEDLRQSLSGVSLTVSLSVGQLILIVCSTRCSKRQGVSLGGSHSTSHGSVTTIFWGSQTSFMDTHQSKKKQYTPVQVKTDLVFIHVLLNSSVENVFSIWIYQDNNTIEGKTKCPLLILPQKSNDRSTTLYQSQAVSVFDTWRFVVPMKPVTPFSMMTLSFLQFLFLVVHPVTKPPIVIRTSMV